jgi:hypothetical protein
LKKKLFSEDFVCYNTSFAYVDNNTFQAHLKNAIVPYINKKQNFYKDENNQKPKTLILLDGVMNKKKYFIMEVLK